MKLTIKAGDTLSLDDVRTLKEDKTVRVDWPRCKRWAEGTKFYAWAMIRLKGMRAVKVRVEMGEVKTQEQQTA